MSPESLRVRLEAAARGAAERVPEATRRTAGSLSRRVRSSRSQVTVVVLADGTEEQVRASLDSARDQSAARLEIVVVVRDERLAPLAHRAAAEDSRVRAVESFGSDHARARQFGAVAARSDWLLFLSPRQLLLPGAVTALLEARGERRTVVVGQVEDPRTSWARLPLLGRLLVPAELWGAALDDGEPDGQTVAVVLVADTYDATGHSYAEALVPVLRDEAATARLLDRVDDPAPELSSRVAQDRSMIASLDRDELAEERAARATGTLGRDLPRFVLGVERYDELQWTRLSNHVEEMVVTAGDQGLAEVPVEDRVALWLAAGGRREELTAFVAARRFAAGELATSVEGGRVLAAYDAAPKDVPEPVLTLGEAETPLRVRLLRSWIDGEELGLELYVGVRNVGSESPAVRVRLVGQPSLALTAEVSSDPAVTRWMAEPHQRHHEGVVRTQVPLAALGPAGWRLEVELDDRGVRRTGTVSGELPTAPLGVLVRRFELAPGRLSVAVTAPQGAQLALTAPGRDIPGTADGDQWVFDLSTDPWGLGRLPAPTGTYRLVLSADGAEIPVALDVEVAGRLPFEVVGAEHRAAVLRSPDGGLLLRLDPPLDDEEDGAWAQRRLQDHYLQVSEPLEPRLVYFQAFDGQSPTDNPGAIQAELRRVLEEAGRSDVRMLWAVADCSTRGARGRRAGAAPQPGVVRRPRARPVGGQLHRARAVVRASRGSAGAADRARLPVPGDGPLPVASRRPDADPRRPAARPHRRDLEHAADADPRDGPLLPRELRLRGPGPRAGLPRAPTRWWRRGTSNDERMPGSGSASRPTSAPCSTRPPGATTDPPTSSTSRPGCTSTWPRRLVRWVPTTWCCGAATPSTRRSGYGAHVVDVTTYPEINDLVLASDAAVLDYSSLRFDLAITGRPMVFLVPDLRDHTEQGGGFLYDFARSAPGPLLDSTAEVVDALADLPPPRAAVARAGWRSSTATTTGWPTDVPRSAWSPSSSGRCSRLRRPGRFQWVGHRALASRTRGSGQVERRGLPDRKGPT